MDDERFIEQTLQSDLVFDGRLLKVYSDKVRLPDDTESFREIIRHPGAAVVIAVLDNGKLLFERQYRYPLGQICLEMPAGKIDKGEYPLDTARRELREETGFKARIWRHLGVMHPAIGYADEKIEIFWAQGLSYVGSELDHDEILEVVELRISDAVLAVRDGDITDAKTITAIMWAEKTLSGEWPLPL